MSNPTANDPLEFLKSLWSSMNMPLPGLVTPTLDTDELEKRIKDLKAVEGWLQSNLHMLQLTIQGLELQRTTLQAMQAMSQTMSNNKASPEAPSMAANPFVNPAMWPWNLMPAATPGAAAVPSSNNEPGTKAK